jgi:hypothetical protein
MSDVEKDTEVKPDDAEDTDFEGHKHRHGANDESGSDESSESGESESDFEGHRHRHV